MYHLQILKRIERYFETLQTTNDTFDVTIRDMNERMTNSTQRHVEQLQILQDTLQRIEQKNVTIREKSDNFPGAIHALETKFKELNNLQSNEKK